ncbi:MAG: hypothetical protein COB85_09925 [Bacteroidetes bacterium]|nr:MAG: hypothetical protein COB85_09925 [Bacteroidota bacterium]
MVITYSMRELFYSIATGNFLPCDGKSFGHSVGLSYTDQNPYSKNGKSDASKHWLYLNPIII